jgi:CubicO group peptidase (beta-lactamase class C family)
MQTILSALARLALITTALTAAAQFAGAQNTSSQAAAAEPARPPIPDTPAGRRFAEWFDAVNSGDLDQMRNQVAAGSAPLPDGTLPVDDLANRNLALYRATDGLILLQAVERRPNSVTAFYQAKRTGFCTEITMVVDEKAPHHVVGVGRRGVEMPAELLPAEPLSVEELGRRADQLLDGLIARDQFSGVLLIAKNGEPIYSRAHGLANRGWNVPNTLDTRFNLASITKMFTAVAIAQLAEQGKLSYDDVVGKFLPDYANKDVAEKVTVRHLLTHTSGLHDDWAAMDRGPNPSREVQTIMQHLAPFQTEPLHTPPGERQQYCNMGYALLGAVIEQASGEDYFDYVQSHIFTPAGMATAGFLDLTQDPPHVATGYMDAPGGQRLSNIFRLWPRGNPYSSAYATAQDLAAFAEALRTDQLVRPATREEMWSGGLPYSEANSRYGFGCIVKEYNGTRLVGHGGGWLGITNKYDTYPDLGYSVVILCNIDNDPNALAFKLREWLAQGAGHNN